MSERIEVTRGSGNVYRDVKRPYADVEQLKAMLAAEIIKRMDNFYSDILLYIEHVPKAAMVVHVAYFDIT